MYQRNLSHSSEGSTWTKKNHKYIRKEGNRYIYPEDVNKTPKARKLVDTITDTSGNKIPIRGASATKTIANRSNRYDKGSGERLSASEVRRRNATNSQGTTDYKKLSEQKSNRSAAANGQVVNPSYKVTGSGGENLGRVTLHTKVSSPNQNEFKEYSKLRSNEEKQIKNRSNVGSGAKNQEYAKQQAYDKKRKAALSKQGSLDRQKEAKSNATKQVKASKEYYDAVRSNTRNEDEFNDYLDKHGVARPDSSELKKTNSGTSKPTVSKSKSVETVKKSTNGQKGHFTYDSKSGQTVFVPDDEGTKKRVSKGKQIVDKIKNAFKKKK